MSPLTLISDRQNKTWWCKQKSQQFFQLLPAFLFIFIICTPLTARDNSTSRERIQFDLQGESHFSHFNFTDIKIPYNGIDFWSELKLALWLNKEKSFAAYISIIPSLTSESEFWWQKNAQFVLGFQWYPFPIKNLLFRGIRLYAQVAYRKYFSEPENAVLQDTDLQMGIDYYYDNLFNRAIFAAALWSNGGYRKTNFSLKDYSAFLWMGNVKIGLKAGCSQRVLMGYLVLEWTYAPQYEVRWWENFFRSGLGLSFYPMVNKGEGYVKQFLNRFHIYVEFLHNVAWFGDGPALGNVEKSDYRIGIGFSTGGYFRDRRNR